MGTVRVTMTARPNVGRISWWSMCISPPSGNVNLWTTCRIRQGILTQFTVVIAEVERIFYLVLSESGNTKVNRPYLTGVTIYSPRTEKSVSKRFKRKHWERIHVEIPATLTVLNDFDVFLKERPAAHSRTVISTNIAAPKKRDDVLRPVRFGLCYKLNKFYIIKPLQFETWSWRLEDVETSNQSMTFFILISFLFKCLSQALLFH